MWLSSGKLHLVVLVLSLLHHLTLGALSNEEIVARATDYGWQPPDIESQLAAWIVSVFSTIPKYTRTDAMDWSYLPHMTFHCLGMYINDGKTRKEKSETKVQKCKQGDFDTKYCYRGECIDNGRCVCCPPIIERYFIRYPGVLQKPLGSWTGPTCNVFKKETELSQSEIQHFNSWMENVPEIEFEIPQNEAGEAGEAGGVNIKNIIEQDGEHRNFEPLKQTETECETEKASCYRGLCRNGKCTDCFVYDGSTGGVSGQYHGEHCDIFIPDNMFHVSYADFVCEKSIVGDCGYGFCTKAGKCYCEKLHGDLRCKKITVGAKKYCPFNCHKEDKRGKCKKGKRGYKRCVCNPGFAGMGCEKPFICLIDGIDICEEGECQDTRKRGIQTQVCMCDKKTVSNHGQLCIPTGKCGLTVCEGAGSRCIQQANGVKICDCAAGRWGQKCKAACNPFFYGRNCLQRCGALGHNCFGPCFIYAGNCKSCAPGYKKDPNTRLNFCNVTVEREATVETSFAYSVEEATLSESVARKRAAESQDAEIVEQLKDENSNLSKTYRENLQDLMEKIAKKKNIGSIRLDITGFELGSVVNTFEVAFPADEVGEIDLNDMLETGLVEEADTFDPGLGEGYKIVKDSIKTSKVRLRTVTRDDDSSSTALIGGIVGAVGFVVVVAVVAVKVKSNQNELAKKKEKGKHAGKKRSKRGSTASNVDSKSEDNVKDKRSAVSKKSKSTKGSKSNKKVASSTA